MRLLFGRTLIVRDTKLMKSPSESSNKKGNGSVGTIEFTFAHSEDMTKMQPPGLTFLILHRSNSCYCWGKGRIFSSSEPRRLLCLRSDKLNKEDKEIFRIVSHSMKIVHFEEKKKACSDFFMSSHRFCWGLNESCEVAGGRGFIP